MEDGFAYLQAVGKIEHDVELDVGRWEEKKERAGNLFVAVELNNERVSKFPTST